MIYMKSTSGNDGSYSLTVSFALGTNPDIDTVNVNNRVQTALPQLPPEVQHAGPDGAQALGGDPAVPAVLQRERQAGRRCSSPTTSPSTCSTGCRARRASARRTLFGKLNYSMRIWFDTQRLTSLNLAPSDIIAAIQSQNVQAPVGRIGARPISRATSSSSSTCRPRAG